MKKVISTTNAPAAIGPYSQAIEANGFVFASGQIPVNPATGEVAEAVSYTHLIIWCGSLRERSWRWAWENEGLRFPRPTSRSVPVRIRTIL